MHNDGMIEDYSINPERSPSISYALTLSNIGELEGCFAMFHESKMTAIMKCGKKTETFQWIFGNNEFQILPKIADDTNKKASTYSLAVSQKSGKIFTYKGTEYYSFFLKLNQKQPLILDTKYLRRYCFFKSTDCNYCMQIFNVTNIYHSTYIL